MVKHFTFNEKLLVQFQPRAERLLHPPQRSPYYPFQIFIGGDERVTSQIVILLKHSFDNSPVNSTIMKFSDLNLLDFGNSITMAGSIYTDGKTNFIMMFPNEELVLPPQFVDITIPQWEELLKQTDDVIIEVEEVQNSELIKAFFKKAQRNLDQSICWKVYERDNFRCRYCYRIGIPLTVDHIDLWEKGGVTTEANLLTACKQCNRNRGNTYYYKWLESKYYKEVSKNLPEEIRVANVAIIATMPHLETLRTTKQRSR